MRHPKTLCLRHVQSGISAQSSTTKLGTDCVYKRNCNLPELCVRSSGGVPTGIKLSVVALPDASEVVAMEMLKTQGMTASTKVTIDNLARMKQKAEITAQYSRPVGTDLSKSSNARCMKWLSLNLVNHLRPSFNVGMIQKQTKRHNQSFTVSSEATSAMQMSMLR